MLELLLFGRRDGCVDGSTLCYVMVEVGLNKHSMSCNINAVLYPRAAHNQLHLQILQESLLLPLNSRWN